MSDRNGPGAAWSPPPPGPSSTGSNGSGRPNRSAPPPPPAEDADSPWAPPRPAGSVAGLPGWDPPGTRDAGAAAAGRPPAPPAPGGPPGPPPGAAPGAGWNPPAPASFVPPAPHLPPGMPGPAGPAGPGWGPPAGPMPGGPGFGYGYGYGPRSMRTVVRHKPGLGALLGVGGFVMLLLSLTVLPWVSAGGHDTSFSDIRKAVHQSDHLNTGGSGGLNPTNTSLPPNLTVPSVPGGGGVGTPVTPPPVGTGGI